MTCVWPWHGIYNWISTSINAQNKTIFQTVIFSHKFGYLLKTTRYSMENGNRYQSRKIYLKFSQTIEANQKKKRIVKTVVKFCRVESTAFKRYENVGKIHCNYSINNSRLLPARRWKEWILLIFTWKPTLHSIFPKKVKLNIVNTSTDKSKIENF